MSSDPEFIRDVNVTRSMQSEVFQLSLADEWGLTNHLCVKLDASQTPSVTVQATNVS